MPKTIPINWLLSLALLGALVLAACGSGDDPEEVTFDLTIQNRAIVDFESALEVKQDDVVTFNITSDEAANFHLHGYDHEMKLEPNATGSVTFTADATGSFPITIHVGEGAGADHHEKTIEAPADMSVGLEAELHELSGVNLKITATGFAFEPDKVDAAHVPGEGHAHVYVDGVKIGRVFDPNYHLTEIDPGERSVRITLNANSHEQYAKGEHPLEATTTITVPGEIPDASDQDSQPAAEPTEIDLGRLIVLPR